MSSRGYSRVGDENAASQGQANNPSYVTGYQAESYQQDPTTASPRVNALQPSPYSGPSPYNYDPNRPISPPPGHTPTGHAPPGHAPPSNLAYGYQGNNVQPSYPGAGQSSYNVPPGHTPPPLVPNGNPNSYRDHSYPSPGPSHYPPGYGQQQIPRPPMATPYGRPVNDWSRAQNAGLQAKLIMENELFTNLCEEPAVCCIACCFPAILATLNQIRVEPTCPAGFATFCCYPFIGGCNRTQIKRSVGAYSPETDSLFTNCLLHCFCSPCALVQEYRAVSSAIGAGTLRPVHVTPPAMQMSPRENYPGNNYPGNNYPGNYPPRNFSPNGPNSQQFQPQSQQFQPQPQQFQPQPQQFQPQPQQFQPQPYYPNGSQSQQGMSMNNASFTYPAPTVGQSSSVNTMPTNSLASSNSDVSVVATQPANAPVNASINTQVPSAESQGGQTIYPTPPAAFTSTSQTQDRAQSSQQPQGYLTSTQPPAY